MCDHSRVFVRPWYHDTDVHTRSRLSMSPWSSSTRLPRTYLDTERHWEQFSVWTELPVDVSNSASTGLGPTRLRMSLGYAENALKLPNPVFRRDLNLCKTFPLSLHARVRSRWISPVRAIAADVASCRRVVQQLEALARRAFPSRSACLTSKI